MEKEFDVVVIGAGPSGEVAAGRLADAGLEVALCERHLVGGECSFYACMPSKALVRPAELIGEVGRVPGVELASDQPTPEKVLARRDEVIHDLDDSGQLPWLEERGIELFRDEARLDGERRVVAGDDVLVARKAVIVATGTTASLPPIPGLAEADPWTNREATTANEVPESLIVIGGGPVGCELAQAWHSLGAAVVLLEAAPRLVPGEEEFASPGARGGAASRHGIDVRTGVEIANVAGEDGRVHVTFEDGETIEAERLMVAAGRRPNSAGIGLETVGLKEGEWIEVDDQLRVDGIDWLYAIGDVNKRSLLTHSGKYQARVACETILGRKAKATSDLGGPATRHLHRPADRGGRADRREGRGGGHRGRDRRCLHLGQRRRELSRTRYAGHLAARDRQGPRRHRRRDLRRLPDGGAPPLGDDRDRRRGADRTARRGDPGLPDPHRDLAAAAREVRALTARASAWKRRADATLRALAPSALARG